MIIELHAKPRVQGFFKLEAVKLDGRKRLLADWFPNLITNVGLNQIGWGSYLSACHVGTNNTAPNVNDTILGGYLAGTTTRQAESSGAQATAPYYGWKTITYRFALGAVVGNVAEVGIATRRENGGSTVLFSRALVLDELGSPTTVTVLADEILDVTYQIRLYPPLADVVQTGVTITGSGTHTVTTRASTVTASHWGGYLGSIASFTPNAPNNIIVYNGAIGSITSGPSGSPGYAYAYNLAYGNNNLYRDGGASYGLNQANLSGGIRSAAWGTTLGNYQCEFDPVITKDATKTLNLIFRLAWARNV